MKNKNTQKVKYTNTMIYNNNNKIYNKNWKKILQTILIFVYIYILVYTIKLYNIY